MLHGCSIGEGSLIGVIAVVFNNTKFGNGCLIGANTLVTEGKVVLDGAMVLGSLGKIVKSLTSEVIEKLLESAVSYQKKAK